MGRDHFVKQHARSGHREAPKSDNVYLKLLVKLYAFLARMYQIFLNYFVNILSSNPQNFNMLLLFEEI